MIGFEQALIGTAMKFPNSISDISIITLPSDFTAVSHQVLWTKIVELEGAAQLSSIAVIESLRASGYLGSIGQDVGSVVGESYIEFLLTKASAASIDFYAGQVVDASIKRMLDRDISLTKVELNENRPADEILERAEQRLYDLRRRKTASGIEIGEILDVLDDTIQGYLTNRIRPAYVPNLEPLRQIVSFFEGQDYIVVGARPADGKSSFLRYEAFQTSTATVKTPFLIVNMDNGEIDYARYFIAHVTGINSFLIRDPRKMNQTQLGMVKDAIKRLKSTPMRIVTLGNPSANEVVSVMKKGLSDGFKVFGIDYIQQIRNPKYIGDEVGNISYSSQVLRGFNMKYSVPVMVASQFNRMIEHRGVDAEPSQADFKGSGSLEQDATILLSVRKVQWTPDQLSRFPENMEVVNGSRQLVPSWKIRSVPVKLYVIKNRNGPVGNTDPIKWDKATNNYEEIS